MERKKNKNHNEWYGFYAMEWKIVKSALIEFQMIDKWNPVFNIKSEENLAIKCYR